MYYFFCHKRRAMNHSRAVLTKQLFRAKPDFHTGVMILKLNLYRVPFRLLFYKRWRAPKFALKLSGSRRVKTPHIFSFSLETNGPPKILLILFLMQEESKNPPSRTLTWLIQYAEWKFSLRKMGVF